MTRRFGRSETLNARNGSRRSSSDRLNNAVTNWYRSKKNLPRKPLIHKVLKNSSSKAGMSFELEKDTPARRPSLPAESLLRIPDLFYGHPIHSPRGRPLRRRRAAGLAIKMADPVRSRPQ